MKTVFVYPVKRYRVRLDVIEHLDSMNLSLGDKFLMEGIHGTFVIRPSRVVPDDVCTLLQHCLESIQLILDIRLVSICHEKSVHVTERLASGDFSAGDNNHVPFAFCLQGNLV